jgi:hypothetical protein
MGSKDLIGGNHGIERFDRIVRLKHLIGRNHWNGRFGTRKSWDCRIESEEIMGSRDLIEGNYRIEGFYQSKSWDFSN